MENAYHLAWVAIFVLGELGEKDQKVGRAILPVVGFEGIIFRDEGADQYGDVCVIFRYHRFKISIDEDGRFFIHRGQGDFFFYGVSGLLWFFSFFDLLWLAQVE